MFSDRIQTYLTQSILVRGLYQKAVRAEIKGVRDYIKMVQLARKGAMATVGGIAGIALFTIGICVLLTGVFRLVPMSETTVTWLLIGVGLLITVGGTVALMIAFNQRRWLEYSKSYELLDVALSTHPLSETVEKVQELRGVPTKAPSARTVETETRVHDWTPQPQT